MVFDEQFEKLNPDTTQDTAKGTQSPARMPKIDELPMDKGSSSDRRFQTRNVDVDPLTMEDLGDGNYRFTNDTNSDYEVIIRIGSTRSDGLGNAIQHDNQKPITINAGEYADFSLSSVEMPENRDYSSNETSVSANEITSILDRN